MRPGRREFQQASVQISIPQNVPDRMREHMREVSHLRVEEGFRRQKQATALLNFVCQEADANRITLVLTAQPDDDAGPTEEQLVAWYKLFGFQVLQLTHNGTYMARQVREKPRIKPVTAAVARALH